jgi:tripartite-type tricarboxylate transporter receptor subunit TctC
MHRRAALGLFAALPFVSRARAQGEYPARPVRVIVGFPPGGGVDLTARPLLAKLAERFGQQFVVENRGGANGNIAMEAAARAAPDGHTLFFGNGGNLAINHALYANLSFDTLRDFAPVAQVVQVPLAVTVPADFPARTIPDFIAQARARPGSLNMGSGGTGGLPHLAFELFRRQAGIDVAHIPYRGSAPALQDLLGGRVQLMIDAYNLSRGAVEAGRVRVIGTTGAARMPALPDVPTVAEQGLPGFAAVGWQGLVAPAGTPEPVRARLEAAVAWAMRETDLPQTYLSQGSIPHFADGAAFRRLIEEERTLWSRVVREGNIQAD